MRTAAVLGLALGVSSQSTSGRSTEAATACDAQGAQSVHVVGVAGTFCVQVRPCEGVVHGEGFSCPLMGQRDVLGETELSTDSCCAVVDSNSGALGCVLVREGDGEKRDIECLWSQAEERAPGSHRRRRRWRWSRVLREEATSDAFDSALRFPVDATRTGDVTMTRSKAMDAPPAGSLSVTTLPEAAEERALESEIGGLVPSAVGLTVSPVVSTAASTVTTAPAPVVTTTPATAASAIPMPTIPVPSVATSTSPAINPAAITTVPESSSVSGALPVPVTSLPELSSLSDSIDEMVLPESSSMSGSADMMIQPELNSMSGSTDVEILPELSSMSGSADMMILPELNSMSGSTDVEILPELSSMSGSVDMMIQPELNSMSGSTDVEILPELSSMSGSSDADLVLAPTWTPSPATLPPFTAIPSSQSGSGFAGAPTVIPTENVTSLQPSTTPPPPMPVPGSNNTTPVPTTALVVSASSSGSDDSDDSGSFPEGSTANMPGPSSAIMSMEFSSSGSGDYPEIESTSAPAGPTWSADGSRAASINANMNNGPVSPPWLDNAGLKSGASSASVDVSDSWSPTSTSRGADSLDNEDSSVESSPSSTAPPLLFPSSGSLKLKRLPPQPSKSAPLNGGVLVLAPITDHGGDSVNPLISGGSQSPVNGEEIQGSDDSSSAADTQTILFIIIGCIVAAALVFGAVWLRPKRANSVDISNLREPPEPMDTSYPYESEPVGPYDASSTPRVIHGYDQMDVRGSNEYFSA